MSGSLNQVKKLDVSDVSFRARVVTRQAVLWCFGELTKKKKQKKEGQQDSFGC